MTKKCRYRKTGTVTVLEEYESDSENDGEDAGWYTLATLHEPGENHTGERLVWALTGLDDLRAQVARLEAANAVKDAALRGLLGDMHKGSPEIVAARAALSDTQTGTAGEVDLDKHTAWDLEHIPHVKGVDYDLPGEAQEEGDDG